MAEKQDAAPAERQHAEQQEISRIAQEAEAKRMDETVPGGRYEVNGVLVNANGEPLKGKDKE